MRTNGSEQADAIGCCTAVRVPQGRRKSRSRCAGSWVRVATAMSRPVMHAAPKSEARAHRSEVRVCLVWLVLSTAGSKGAQGSHHRWNPGCSRPPAGDSKAQEHRIRHGQASATSHATCPPGTRPEEKKMWRAKTKNPGYQTQRPSDPRTQQRIRIARTAQIAPRLIEFDTILQ